MADDGNTPVFGRFLRFWRQVHKVSQEELAARVHSSPRHISRLENGSSRPGENLIEDIAQALEMGERDRNHLRLAAGYSPRQRHIDFHAAEFKWLRKAMLLTLRAMDPYPASLMDSAGTLLMVNRAWVGFYRATLPAVALDRVNNHFDFLFSRQGAGHMLSGWEDTLSMIVMSLTQEAMLNPSADRHAVLDKLLGNPTVPRDWAQRAARLEPMASFRVQADYGGALRRFYSVSQIVGALGPTAYASEPKLTISTLYPEDETLDMSALLESEATHPLLLY